MKNNKVVFTIDMCTAPSVMNERNSVDVLYTEIKVLSVYNKILMALGVLWGTMGAGN